MANFVLATGLEPDKFHAESGSSVHELGTCRDRRGVGENGDLARRRHEPMQDFEPLYVQFGGKHTYSSSIATRTGKRTRQSRSDHIIRHAYNGYCGCRLLCSANGRISPATKEGIDFCCHKLGCSFRELLGTGFPASDYEVPPLREASSPQF